MKMTDLTSSQAKQLLQLISKKEELLNRISEVDERISSIAESRGSYSVTPASGKGEAGETSKRKVGRKRGALGEAILNAVQNAGDNGITIKELSQIIGGPRQRVDSWFYMNAKKFKGLKRIEKGKWKMVS